MSALRTAPTLIFRNRQLLTVPAALNEKSNLIGIPVYLVKRSEGSTSSGNGVEELEPLTKFGPTQPFLESPSLVFNPKNIMKHYEVIPIILIVAIGFSCEVLYTIRQAFTRDDVAYTRAPPACEIVETRSGPMYPAPIRKMVVFNQKYETPPDLLSAIGGSKGCPMKEVEEEPVEETLDWYLLFGRFVPWALWGAFLTLFDLF